MSTTGNEFRAGVYALLPAVIGGIPFGLITGVAGVKAGLTPFETIFSSFAIFSGIAQLIIYQLYASASPIPIILLAVFVASLRLMMYSATLAPYLGHGNLRWKLALSYMTTDQGFAATVARFQTKENLKFKEAEYFHLGGGIIQWVPWQIFVSIGAILGTAIPASWSLDFTIPLVFLAMLIPAIKSWNTALVAIVSGCISLIAINLPLKLSLIVAAISGIVAGMLFDRRR